MPRRMRSVLAATLAVGVVLVAGAAAAAPGPKLKQFRVPTADSQPRSITTGSDGNRWFTEGTEFTNAPAKIARVTPAGDITEFAPDAADGCNFCILSDIAQGPGNILYVTSNDPTLIRFNVATETFETPIQMPNSNALGGNLAIHGDDIWITDFNNNVVWRYSISTDQFTSFPFDTPIDVAVDAAGNAWVALPFADSIGRIDAVIGETTTITATDGTTTMSPRSIAVASDGQIWFTARFTPQGVGRLDPADNSITLFPLTDEGPQEIAPSPDGSLWFTQSTAGNVAQITNDGTITPAKTVKGSQPFGIVVADNGNPWYTMISADKIGTLLVN